MHHVFIRWKQTLIPVHLLSSFTVNCIVLYFKSTIKSYYKLWVALIVVVILVRHMWITQCFEDGMKGVTCVNSAPFMHSAVPYVKSTQIRR